jgi:DNA mismatch repair protein
MRLGDKVRFLNEIGGGKIVAFQKNNIVLVEDEDGFEIPISITDIAVVSSDDYSTAKTLKSIAQNEKAMSEESDNRSIKAILNGNNDNESILLEEDDEDPADKIVSFKAPVEEVKGRNKLTAYLAFIPTLKDISTNTLFKSYFINDSNYHLQYIYCIEKENNWLLYSSGVIKANTKEFISEVHKSQLNDLEKVCIQIIAYKEDKEFILKPCISSQFRIEAIKFCKQSSFQENPFLDAPALLYTIVKDDKIVRPLQMNVEEISESMLTNNDAILKENQNKSLDSEVQKNDVKKNTIETIKKDKEGNEFLIIDLHANKLLEHTEGLTSLDILNYQLKKFRDTLDYYRKKKNTKIVFIHGKGEGILRNAIINELRFKYKSYQYQDASFQEYGYGATQVTIK